MSRLLRNALRICGGTLVLLYAVWVYLVWQESPNQMYPGLDTPFDDARFDHVTIDAPDGVPIRVAIRPGPTPDAAAILYFMGNAGSRHYFGNDLDPLLDLPMSVIVMGYRGGEGDPHTPSEDAIKSDARAVLAALPDLLGAAPRERHVIGYSMGSGMALDLAAGNDLSSVILKAPMPRICDMIARHTFTPVCWLPGAPIWDNYALAGQVTEPVLMIHGDRDQLFSQDEFERLAGRFPSPPTRIIYDDTGHNDFRATTQNADMTGWLRTGWRTP